MEPSVRLEPRSVADFYSETMALLAELGLVVEINPVPSEVIVAIPSPQDEQHASYDAEYAQRFWLSLVQAKRVFTQFRSPFLGKVSPVHFFWAASTSPSPGSPAGPLPSTRAASPTALTGSPRRATATR
jgi:hypothetical protein